MTETNALDKKSKTLLALCYQALEDTKADDIMILNVGSKSSITNFFVLATGNSLPHLKALKRDLDVALKSNKIMVLGSDEGDYSGWSVVDAFDVMIHLFTPDTRKSYDLEALWKDATRVERSEIFPESD